MVRWCFGAQRQNLRHSLEQCVRVDHRSRDQHCKYHHHHRVDWQCKMDRGRVGAQRQDYGIPSEVLLC